MKKIIICGITEKAVNLILEGPSWLHKVEITEEDIMLQNTNTKNIWISSLNILTPFKASFTAETH